MKQHTIIYRTLCLLLLMIARSGMSVWGYGENTSYVLNESTEYKYGKYSNYSKEFSLSGSGETLTFDIWKTTAATFGMYIFGYNSTGSETQLAYYAGSDLSTDPTSKQIKISPDIVKIKIRNGSGNYAGCSTLNYYVKNVKITRLTTFSITTSSITFDSQSINTSTTKAANISYNNTTYNQQVTGSCTDNHFTVTSKDVGATGSTTININYTSSTPGTHSGTVTLNMNGKSVSFPVSGTSTAKYNFEVTTAPNFSEFGSATATVDASITSSRTSESKQATFTATANSGYEFIGWGTTPNATEFESTANPYKPTLTNNIPGSTTSKSLYAIFKPFFLFSATANKINGDFGNADVTCTGKIIGEVDDLSKTISATFTATPSNDCTFEGWYSDEAHTTLISNDATYTTTLTNEEIGSTKNLTLYAWFKKNQTLTWNTQLTNPYGLVVGSSVECAATASSSLPITYQSFNSNVASISAEGLVTGIASSPDAVTITASQPGNDQYNAATSITRIFYVLDKLFATFTPNDFEGTSPTFKIGDSRTITIANVDENFSFSSSDPSVVDIAKEEDVITLTALKAGTANITLTQPENATHNASSVVYNITVEKHQGNLSISIPNEMKVGETCSDFYTTENNEVAVNVSSDNTNVVSYANGTLTAVGEGTATITVSQAESDKWVGESKTRTIIVSKNENTLNVSITQTETEVDGTISINVSNQNNIETPLSATITETVLSSNVNNGTDVIVFENGAIKAKNAGTAKIKIVQATNTAYKAYESQEYTITVEKISNHITITLDGEQRNSKNVARGTTIALGYSSPSDAQFNVTRTSGSDAIATISGNSIMSGQTDGTNIWTIRQTETYKYEAAEASVRIKVNSIAEEDSFLYAAYTDGNKYDWNTGSGKYSFNIDYEPLEIRFKVWYSNNSINSGVNEYVTLTWKNANGTTLGTKKTDFLPYKENNAQSYTVQLPSDARSFTFEASGSFHQYVKEVYVVRKTYIRATTDKTNLGTIYTDQTASSTFTIDYGTSNGGPIEIISSNDHFEISQTPINVDVNSNGSKTFIVTYKPNPEQLGVESATITASDLFNFSTPITLTAACQKYSTSISKNYNDAASAMKVGNTIENAFSFSGTSTGKPSSDSQNADFYYLNSNPSAVTYDPETNSIIAIGGGEATITICQKKTNLYHATSQQFTFNVSRNENPLILSIDKTNLKVEETAAVSLINNISNGAISASYTIDGVVNYDSETGKITAIGAGTTTITLTQAVTNVYESKSQSFEITVTKHEQTISWDNEVITSMLIGTTLTTNTATASSGLQVTYTSSNPGAISVDANTGELTALAAGTNIIITVTQAGNYKFNPASITRTFMVFAKINVTITTSLAEGETNELPIGDTATLGSNAPITDSNIHVTGNENGIISWTLSDNEITITPIKEGTVTIQMDRAEDDDYFAISKSYTIKVIKPVLVLDPTQTISIDYNGYSSVMLKRTLPTGYCTICLPFSTTPEYFGEGTWAAQLSLVTYNVNDGFTLFFTKCSTIETNKPYILYLGSQVTNPIWQDVENVTSATPQSISSKGWTMIGNYTPNFDMEGKYGVVSSTSNIRKGSSGSKLNAFTAYFTYAGASNVKVHASYLEDEGELSRIEDIEGFTSSESHMIYDLQGRKVEKASKGIYIVNGKKILN